MAMRCCRLSLLALALVPAAGAEADVEALEALAADDQCASGNSSEACGLNAMQLRGAVEEDQPKGWFSVGPEPFHSFDASKFSHGCGCCCNHEEKISEIWGTCADRENACCKSCGIWHAQHSRGKHSSGGKGTKYVGEKVVPSRPIGGMEGITANTAGGLDYLWNAAAGKAGHAAHMAVIANPWQSRTQHQLHLIVKPLDSRGASLARKLEKMTKCEPGKWFNLHKFCHYSKARLFDGMPPVFSEVYKMASHGRAMGNLISNPQGQWTLASVGIAMLFICNGKPVLVATGNGNGFCSIEHSIA